MTSLMIVTLILGANAYTDIFADANRAYTAGDYGNAIEQYEKLINDSVVDPAVFYNVGNAYYRAGQLGPAIVNYERALQLDSHFENARENLAMAVRQTQTQLERPLPPDWEQSLLFWHYGLNRQTTFTVALVSWILLWCVLTIRQWRRFSKSRLLVAGLLVLSLAFGASAWAKAHPAMLAVTQRDTVPVHFGTDPSEKIHFELREGDRVTVDKRTSEWVRVTTVDGKRGWARANELIMVGPPYASQPSN